MKRIICVLFLLSCTVHAVARRPKIKLAEVLSVELNRVLAATDELHTACVEKDENKIVVKTKGLLQAIDKARAKINLAKQQKPHLERILNAAEAHLELTQLSEGDQRRQNLKDAFAQLVQVAQVFSLDKYLIYFCPKDRAVWLQKNSRSKGKASNPVSPTKHPSCGRLVR